MNLHDRVCIKALVKNFDQSRIQLHGNYLCGLPGDLGGEHPDSRSYFDNDIFRTCMAG
jgi:hypothetical protein